MNTLEIASIGLRDDMDRMRMLGHNVANLTTPGYKRQVAVGSGFSSLMRNPEAEAPGAPSTHVDLARGKLRASGGPLDAALAEREFLVVQRPDGGLGLSRGGSLQLDAQGRLTTAEGHVVQASRGSLTVPTAVSAARLDSGAQLMGDDKALGTLRIVTLPKETQVMALGDGLYETSTAVDGLPTPESVSIHAGHIEVSNVVASQEMVHLMTTMRHAESMVKLIQGADELLEKAIRKLGDMS